MTHFKAIIFDIEIDRQFSPNVRTFSHQGQHLMRSEVKCNQLLLLSLIYSLLGTCIVYFIVHTKTSSIDRSILPKLFNDNLSGISPNLSPSVHIINLSQPVNTHFYCKKAKTLLHYINTTLCLHEKQKDSFVSATFYDNTSIWEEDRVTGLLQHLIRHPHLDFIDIGASIGTYTIYAAALGRFVLSIDCFAPNIQRIHRAVQIANVVNRVVLIENAIFTHSGQYLRLSKVEDNIGGQELDVYTNFSQSRSEIDDNPYIVKTIQFDDLMPILVARGIRGFIMKIDIEGSESFVVESGSRIFDTFEIPLIQMEWQILHRHPDRKKVVLDFFTKRHYDSKTFACQLLDPKDHNSWPDDLYWVKRDSPTFC